MKTTILLTTVTLLTATSAQAQSWRETVLDGVESRTTERLETRETLPAGEAAETRLNVIAQRLDARDDRAAPLLRPDIRLIRRGTRLDYRIQN